MGIFLTYEKSLEIINKLNNFDILNNNKISTENITIFLNKINNPENNLKYIHVAGTNGKGSVCFMLAEILKNSGYKTGLYISPHIYDIRERIQVNNKLISKEDFADLTQYISNLDLKNSLSQFEFLTVLSFLYFNKQNCDIVILETGLGGKFDATNVIKNNICSIITSISLDHTQILGDNIQKISLEKAGIIKTNSCTIVGPNQNNTVYENIKKICKIKNNKFVISNLNKIKFKNNNSNFNLIFDYKNLEINTNLIGEYQKENICTVLTVLEEISNEFEICNKNIKKSLEKLYIPCRMQIINKNPLVILDATHNINGAEKLRLFIKNNLKNKKITAIIGVFKDKDIHGILKTFSGCFNKVIAIQSDSDRAINVEDLSKIASLYCSEVISCHNINNIKNILKNASEQEVFVVFGSFSIMKFIKNTVFNNNL